MLPDEVILEILSPALKVSDKLFSDTSEVSPFSNYSPSTSSYLLVCKDWLRVGTPLLYNVVVLRSTAQANALQAVLLDHPEFGLFIKRLRVEGGYGSSMYTILTSAPNITDLFLQLAIWSSDNTVGLCDGLDLINPHRVILVDWYDRRPMKNRQQEALRQTILSCIPAWNNLRIFGFPYGSGFSETAGSLEYRALELSNALVQTQVHTVVVGGYLDEGMPQFILALCNISSLKVLQLQRPMAQYYGFFLSHMELNPQLRTLVKFTESSDQGKIMTKFTEPDITPSLNPDFVPMEFASEETREIVWKRVLFFAMYVEELRSPKFPRRPTESHPSRLPILCVSKYFHRLGLPYLYDSLRLRSYFHAPGIKKQLQDQPHLASFIRRVTYTEFWPDSDVIITIFHHATHLEVFTPTIPALLGISLEAFGFLAKTAGHSLQKLSVSLLPLKMSTSVPSLKLFTSLRVLELGGRRLGPELRRFKPPRDALSTVHTLRIWDDSESGVLLRLFANMRLKSLHTLRLPDGDETALTRLLAVHAEKLLHLTVDSAEHFPILDSCPNLLDIEIRREYSDLRKLTPESPHYSLTKITAGVIPKNLNDVEFKSEMFPALREIQMHSLQWPTTEREILKSDVVPFAESLLQQNIKLMSKSGKHWIPRLKISGTARKV